MHRTGELEGVGKGLPTFCQVMSNRDSTAPPGDKELPASSGFALQIVESLIAEQTFLHLDRNLARHSCCGRY